MIPKTLYLYWGGRPLSWLRYMTVVSFKKYNPGWAVKVYFPTAPNPTMTWPTDEQKAVYKGEDYMGRLEALAKLIPFDASVVGLPDSAPEVHKSDLFRLWVLHEYGGVYVDFDVLFCKPMPRMTKRMFCHHPAGHYAIGLLAAKKGDPLMAKLLAASHSIGEVGKYQAFGSNLWSSVIQDEPDGWNIPKDLIYSCNWHNSNLLFTEIGVLPDDAIGAHWYGGSLESSGWEARLTPETLGEYQSTITELVKGL